MGNALESLHAMRMEFYKNTGALPARVLLGAQAARAIAIELLEIGVAEPTEAEIRHMVRRLATGDALLYGKPAEVSEGIEWIRCDG